MSKLSMQITSAQFHRLRALIGMLWHEACSCGSLPPTEKCAICEEVYPEAKEILRAVSFTQYDDANAK